MVVREPAQFETGIKAYDGSVSCPQLLKSWWYFNLLFQISYHKMTFGPKNVLDLVYEIIKPRKAFKIYFKDIFMYLHSSILKQTMKKCLYMKLWTKIYIITIQLPCIPQLR